MGKIFYFLKFYIISKKLELNKLKTSFFYNSNLKMNLNELKKPLQIYVEQEKDENLKDNMNDIVNKFILNGMILSA
jgi:hypothetical protein